MLCVAACGRGDDESCTDLEKARRYELEVIERWDESSRFAHEVLFDLRGVPPCTVDEVPLGMRELNITSGLAGEDCYLPKCPDDLPTPSEQVHFPGVIRASALCASTSRKTELAACEVVRDLTLERVNHRTEVFDAPVEGQLPPVVMVRRLSYGDARAAVLSCGDPGSVFPDEARRESDGRAAYECGDAWVVRLRER
jgi:hypothetical protein